MEKREEKMTVLTSRFSRTRFYGGFSGVDRLRSNLVRLSRCGVDAVLEPYADIIQNMESVATDESEESMNIGQLERHERPPQQMQTCSAGLVRSGLSYLHKAS